MDGLSTNDSVSINRNINISVARVKENNKHGNNLNLNKSYFFGELEYSILKHLYESGLRRFKLAELRHIADVRRIHDALKRLCKRNIINKIARGLYEVKVNLHNIISNVVVTKKSSSARVKENNKHEGASCVVGCNCVVGCGGVLLFDNVRGFVGGGWVGGDRGRRLLGCELASFSGVSYVEPCVVSSFGVSFGGVLKVYRSSFWVGSNFVNNATVVEWCPPSGFVRLFGVSGAVKEFKRVLIESFIAIAKALASLYGRSSLTKLFKYLVRRGFRDVVAEFIRDVIGGMELDELCRILYSSVG